MNKDIVPEEFNRSLSRLRLIPELACVQKTPMPGGVSSDIWCIETEDQIFCVKRALPKLKVQQEWSAPVERNRYEHRWYSIANKVIPGVAPQVLAYDDEAGVFAMEFLPVTTHPLWKGRMLNSRTVDPKFAGSVGQTLGKIHAATARSSEIAKVFSTRAYFEQLRLDPYLRATGRKHPKLSENLNRLADDTTSLEIALVHGDVSPKNILVGPKGPVFLDAECAWYGDPAFDLAFCLNHLLLKFTILSDQADRLLECFQCMRDSYLAEVKWESASALEKRAGALLPGLFLARVDGKSPVEYITDESIREKVRQTAIPLILDPPKLLQEVVECWRKKWP